MKKQALFLLAGGLLTFAACTNDQAPAGGYTQEQVDSTVDARLAELQAQMMADNDAKINELAQWKADSMIAASKGKKPATTKPKVTTPPPTTTTPVTATPAPSTPKTVQGGGLKSQSDQNKADDKSSVQGGGLKSQSDQKKTEDKKAVQGGGLKSQSDQEVKK